MLQTLQERVGEHPSPERDAHPGRSPPRLQGAPEHADADAGGAAPDTRAGATAAERRPLPAHQEQQERSGQDEARLQAANGRTTAGQYFTPSYLQID